MHSRMFYPDNNPTAMNKENSMFDFEVQLMNECAIIQLTWSEQLKDQIQSFDSSMVSNYVLKKGITLTFTVNNHLTLEHIYQFFTDMRNGGFVPTLSCNDLDNASGFSTDKICFWSPGMSIQMIFQNCALNLKRNWEFQPLADVVLNTFENSPDQLYDKLNQIEMEAQGLNYQLTNLSI